MFMKCSLSVKKRKILVPTFHKIPIPRKTKYCSTSCLFFLDSVDLWHYSSKHFKKIYRKTLICCFNILNFNMLPTPSKTLGDHPRKRRESKDGLFFWFATKCMCRATYDLNVEAISLAIGQGFHSSQLI